MEGCALTVNGMEMLGRMATQDKIQNALITALLQATTVNFCVLERVGGGAGSFSHKMRGLEDRAGAHFLNILAVRLVCICV